MTSTNAQGAIVAKPASILAPNNVLIGLLKHAINSGNYFRDFRTRALLCVAAASILLCLPTLAVDLVNGNLALVLISGLGGLAMIIAVGAMLLNQRVELGVNIVLLTLTAMMCALLFARQGATLGFYVGIPAVLFLANLLASRSLAIVYWLLCAALLALAAYLGHAHWQTVIDMRDPVIAAGGLRIGLIILFFNLLTVMVFRDSIRDLLRDFQAKKAEVARINAKLAQTIHEKQAWVSALGRIHDAGLAIAWWYDSKTGLLQYTAGSAADGNTHAVVKTVKQEDRDALDSHSWQAKILDAIASAGMHPHSWAREIRGVDKDRGETRWYALSADVAFADTGGVQVIGTLQDITAQKNLQTG
ncbi:MAG: hypothetical protein WBN40_00700 [Pseudomonadales bacterium]